MLSKVLIANRGEIARRIIRSCRRLGLGAVAVYSEADAGLAHVSESDEAVCIGPASARESYLRAETIIDAARRCGCDAVHPGYGFLSENAEFAQAVIEAGIHWIGPRPKTIEAMGDKDRARAIAASVGVPIVPGSGRFENGSVEGVAEAAVEIGYPLLVKASAGGGGIGMKRVDALDDIVAVAEATQSMAAKAFGDGTIFLEKLVPKARHLEIQVFGFGNREGIHLFERDCSVQRRFQKIIEESPAPSFNPSIRKRMTEAAVDVCRAINYVGAGTVEFILDVDTQDFYFLELNTRIQVEHPVTEMVTGLDLVAMQIECAAGTLMPISQSDISMTGAAIECRLYAEKPDRLFMPSPGSLERFRFPEEGDGIRIDTGYQEGDAVTPYYDPMIAKLIFLGKTRDDARQKAIDSLTQVEIAGISTNREFLIACLNHREFSAGTVHTSFVDVHLKDLIGA